MYNLIIHHLHIAYHSKASLLLSPFTLFIIPSSSFSAVCVYEFVCYKLKGSKWINKINKLLVVLLIKNILDIYLPGHWSPITLEPMKALRAFPLPSVPWRSLVRPWFSLNKVFLAVFCSAALVLTILKRQSPSSFRAESEFRIMIHLQWFLKIFQDQC